MVSVLLRACAMPFGYTSDMIDSDFTCDDLCFSTAEMNSRNIQRPRGLPAPLPDVILSHTPQPSPLRRSQSYLSFFPEKLTHALPTPTLDMPQAVPSTTTLGVRRNSQARSISVGNLTSLEESVRMGLKRIRKVRHRIQSDEPQSYQNHTLPQLSWPSPRPHRNLCYRLPREGESVRDDAVDGEHSQEETEEQGRWRKAGRELRKIADHFELNTAKVAAKRSKVAPLNLVVPGALTRCLTASLLCLVWWRLLNKLR
nr:uncharacterized protein LOC123748579 [Procambarus clarkii]